MIASRMSVAAMDRKIVVRPLRIDGCPSSDRRGLRGCRQEGSEQAGGTQNSDQRGDGQCRADDNEAVTHGWLREGCDPLPSWPDHVNRPCRRVGAS